MLLHTSFWYCSQFQGRYLCVILWVISGRRIYLNSLYPGQEMIKVQFSFHLILCVCVNTDSSSGSRVCLQLPFSQAGYINLPLSRFPCFLIFSAGIPSNRLVPVAMAIGRTHLESVTTAKGPPMSCLMSTALLSSSKVGVGSFNRKFGFSHAWVH